MTPLSEETVTWEEADRGYLLAAVSSVRDALERAALRRAAEADTEEPAADLNEALPQLADPAEAASTLTHLCDNFGLSEFERDTLLLAIGAELDESFAPLCAAACGDTRRPFPTFGLAHAALAGAHWSAFTPAGPLRRWHLVELLAGETLMSRQLRVDERVLHHLMGASALDERLRSFVEPVGPPSALPFSYRAHAERLVSQLPRGGDEGRPWAVVQLCGDARGGKRALAAVVCGHLGLRLHGMSAADIPAASAERDALARLWEREAALLESALVINLESAEHGDAVRAFAERVQGLLFVCAEEPLGLPTRPSIVLHANRPAAQEQRALWEHALGPLAATLNGQLEAVVAQFPLDVLDIERAGRAVRVGAALASEGLEDGAAEPSLGPMLWEACRAETRQPLDSCAQRIETRAGWDDIVLPEAQAWTLREISAHVRQRARVYDTWGFAARGLRGLGITALFAGPSGTGKTLAAEILAHELSLDLYRIDLSRVVSKYIGETEKNLRRVFDAAEEGGAVLLFDEADALFGKRSEVRDSHDRYANIEVSYLLQRMEAYRGLAILTTNMRGSLDTAFLRRLRFVVNFPFPDAPLRARIWERAFPAATPTEGLDVTKLARLNLAGGNIRNIALNAAFLAADRDEPVRMSHLLLSTRGEYLKLEKPLSESEIGGWL